PESAVSQQPSIWWSFRTGLHSCEMESKCVKAIVRRLRMRNYVLAAWVCLTAGFAQTAPPKHRVLFNRFRMPEIQIMIADADGKNERVLAPHGEIEYSPSYSPDGKWVVFTQERGGSSDIYRIHPDGTGLERLTDDPAFDDQGALSPDGRSLAFISTRGDGTANLWLL